MYFVYSSVSMSVPISQFIPFSYPLITMFVFYICDTPQSLGFCRQEYWSGLLFPSPVNKFLYSFLRFHVKGYHIIFVFLCPASFNVTVSKSIMLLQVLAVFLHCIISVIENMLQVTLGLPWQLSGPRIQVQCRRCSFDPQVKKIPQGSALQFTPLFFSGESHGLKSLIGFSPQGHKESDMIERWSIHTKVTLMQMTAIYDLKNIIYISVYFPIIWGSNWAPLVSCKVENSQSK